MSKFINIHGHIALNIGGNKITSYHGQEIELPENEPLVRLLEKQGKIKKLKTKTK